MGWFPFTEGKLGASDSLIQNNTNLIIKLVINKLNYFLLNRGKKIKHSLVSGFFF